MTGHGIVRVEREGPSSVEICAALVAALEGDPGQPRHRDRVVGVGCDDLARRAVRPCRSGRFPSTARPRASPRSSPDRRDRPRHGSQSSGSGAAGATVLSTGTTAPVAAASPIAVMTSRTWIRQRSVGAVGAALADRPGHVEDARPAGRAGGGLDERLRRRGPGPADLDGAVELVRVWHDHRPVPAGHLEQGPRQRQSRTRRSPAPTLPRRTGSALRRGSAPSRRTSRPRSGPTRSSAGEGDEAAAPTAPTGPRSWTSAVR